ncbi:hypothetical protein SAY86_022862 [Trapa natans]|uniref:60S acidic ribosomal protein P1-like n=1 Tax=Trapa natans TaxID=22666 RepID=A0AAN7M605_TRANT|nr:hypothetical protein SAY86_022862 [Trapa natans]
MTMDLCCILTLGWYVENLCGAEKIAILVKSSNVSVESYWPSLFAKLAEKRNIDDLILNVGSGGSVAPVAAAVPIGGAAAAAPIAEEKEGIGFTNHSPYPWILHGVLASSNQRRKTVDEPTILVTEELKEESDDDMCLSLFD